MSEQLAPIGRIDAEARRDGFESLIFNSRWLMAPFISASSSARVLLLKSAWCCGVHPAPAPGSKESDIILGVLSLSTFRLPQSDPDRGVFGYENFVSKIDPGGHPDWPDWMTKVNFGGLKQKLLASIVAISAIQVLKAS